MSTPRAINSGDSQVDVAVVGAGPAGLGAAIEAARYGLQVTVFDEAPEPGGRLLLQCYEVPRKPGGGRWWKGRNVAERLVDEALALGVNIHTGMSVFGLFPGPGDRSGQTGRTAPPGQPAQPGRQGLQLAVKPAVQYGPGDQWAKLVNCDRVVVATGASERALPIEGWTLPGVLTAGGAQAMVNVQGVRLGRRVLIVGADHLGLLLALQLNSLGVDVMGIALPRAGVLSGRRAQPREVLPELAKLAASAAPSALIRTLAGWTPTGTHRAAASLFPAAGLKLFGIRLWLRQAVMKLRGAGRVEEALLAPVDGHGKVTGPTRSVDVDTVCLSGGLNPLIELVAAAGARCTNIPQLGGYVPLFGPNFETTVDGIHVAGNITGIEGAPAAVEQGRLVGLSLATRLCDVGTDRAGDLIERQRRRLAEARQSSIIQLNPHAVAGRKVMAQLWRAYRLQQAQEQHPAGDVDTDTINGWEGEPDA